MSITLKPPRIADAELILLIRNGQREGAEVLYDTYARFLFLAIIRIVPEREPAESALQATIKKIWSSIDEYVIENERIYSWMIALARKTALDVLAETRRNYENQNEGVYARKG